MEIGSVDFENTTSLAEVISFQRTEAFFQSFPSKAGVADNLNSSSTASTTAATVTTTIPTDAPANVTSTTAATIIFYC